jgi:uncharacterized membrane protein (UPF0136 family)
LRSTPATSAASASNSRIAAALPGGVERGGTDVAAAVRLLHRRQSWGRAAATSFLAFLLAAGASSSAQSQGTPPPPWFQVMIIVLGALTIAGIGAAYLADAGKTVAFDPVSYQASCSQYDCQTSTSGILETGGAGVEATWPEVVPLGKSFQVREPVWRWGLGEALIDSDGIAVAAVLIGLLIEGSAVLVVIQVVKLARNWRRHRQQRTAPASVSTPRP